MMRKGKRERRKKKEKGGEGERWRGVGERGVWVEEVIVYCWFGSIEKIVSEEAVGTMEC